MPVAPLLAPGGVEMRVVSQVAAFTWGSWNVEWPEGYEPPDPPAEDRELGWIADLGDTDVEPFGRCFVRADAQIDATLGRSNVEDVLDAAKYRTSGEVFLETEIPFENLAGQLPYRDFDVNSFVPVRVGGRILEDQLVTKVAESEDEQGKRTATVYLGGQKFQDREALRTANREIDRVIAQERLERGDEIGARLAASQEYEREQRGELKKYVDQRDGEVTEHADTAAGKAEDNAKEHAENEDRKLKRGVDLIIGENGSLTRQVRELNDDYTAKLGANGSVISDQAAHQRMLEGIVYGKPVSELTGTAFARQQQAVNEMNAAFQGKQTTINEGFDYLFGLNERINLAQDYTIAYNRIMAEAFTPRQVRLSYRFENGQIYDAGGYDASGTILMDKAFFKDNLGDFKLYLPTSTGNSALYVLKGSTSSEGGEIFRTVAAEFNNVRFIGVDESVISLEIDKNGSTAPIYHVLFSGVAIPTKLLPKYRQQLDDLAREYRAKGLRI